VKTNWILAIVSLILIFPCQSGAKKRYKDLEKIVPYEKIEELRVIIEIGIADLIIEQVEGDNLLEAKIHYLESRGEPRIRYDRSGKVGHLTIQSGDACEDDDREISGLKTGDERWQLRFSTKVPTSFEIEVGLVDGTIDMTALKVTDLTLSSGLSDLDLRFDEPNSELLDEIRIECGLGGVNARNLGNANFRRLWLESGLGSVKLDLSGDWRLPRVEIDVEVGLGSACLEVPEAIGIEVNADDNFLSSLNLARDILEVREGLHRSSNWEEAAHRLVIDAEVGLGSLKVKRID